MAFKSRFDDRAIVACPVKKCGGVLFDVSSRMAMACGVKHVKCDKCGQVVAIKVQGD